MSSLESSYLVLGTDSAKIDKVVARLSSHFPAEAIEQYMASSGSSKSLIEGFQTLGLLAQYRLVLFEL